MSPKETPPQANGIVGRRVLLPGHFTGSVLVEASRPLGSGQELRIRTAEGSLEEVVLSEAEFSILCSNVSTGYVKTPVFDPPSIRLLVESTRIRLAYAYDRQFAVSVSGIRTLPHQIEAVYMRMLRQPRLRFLLADDPGAGKTIMAGLYLKEMKLRQAIEKILILVPAPLTIQWQDDLKRFFGEDFQIIHSGNDQQQLLNLWQRENQIVASIDYAKQESVRERVWQQDWDLIIIDEAHKCSAFTKTGSGRSPEAGKTRRYQLAEVLTAPGDRNVLLLTATPHHGDEDRFGHFLRLVDPDLFPEPHLVGPSQVRHIRRTVFRLGENCPWALRRLKEDLRDLEGRRLFPDRHVQTFSFSLNDEEFSLYRAVMDYINRYLPRGLGKQKQSIALTRTVFQRRLASSTRAIHESLRRRLERQRGILEDLESLPHQDRLRYLERLRGKIADDEQDEDDLDEDAKNRLTDDFTVAQEMEQIREEVTALRDLVEQAGGVRNRAPDSKLQALRKCLDEAQFSELRDGRGKLLVFTEHRDTLAHVREHLEQWGYSTCEIHGGMNPHERKQAQDDFRARAQVCVATEAAGEGINLQFCHLMINYDLPWNPTRLEQRMGRVHRIGQDRDVYVFNFVADQSVGGEPIIEGKILRTLLDKMDLMRDSLGRGRVYDVIGEVLSINEVDLPDMLREAAYDPKRLDEYVDQIRQIDPSRLREYEEATGIALARETVSVQGFQQANLEAEERRLMPEYVLRQFLAAAPVVGLDVESRADGLFRIERVPQELRSDRLRAIKRLGRPEASYRKFTFYKKHLEEDRHLDAVLMGPGHPLYAAVDEVLLDHLVEARGSTTVLLDPRANTPYWLHFLELEIRGEPSPGRQGDILHAELLAVRQDGSSFSIAPSDIIHDLAQVQTPPSSVPLFEVQDAIDFVKSGYQLEQRLTIQKERAEYRKVVEDFLSSSFEVRVRAAEARVMSLRGREARGEREVSLPRQNAERALAELKRAREERLGKLGRLAVARAGPVRHIASILVLAPGGPVSNLPGGPDDENEKRIIELAAMEIVMTYERERGWEPEDLTRPVDKKIGFDIRSLGPPDPATGVRAVRRIEVKGRKRGQPVRLTTNEWLKARQLADTYWLYVVWDPREPGARPLLVSDPAHKLENAKHEIQEISHFELPAEAIERVAEPSGR